MENLNSKLKSEMIKTYKRFGDKNAMFLRNGESFTGFQIAKEIENETERGIEVIMLMLNLTIDLVKRDVINLEPNVKDCVESLFDNKDKSNSVNDFCYNKFQELIKPKFSESGVWCKYTGFNVVSKDEVKIKYDHGYGDMEFNDELIFKV